MKNKEQTHSLFGIALFDRPRWQQFLICSYGCFFGYLVHGICETQTKTMFTKTGIETDGLELGTMFGDQRLELKSQFQDLKFQSLQYLQRIETGGTKIFGDEN